MGRFYWVWLYFWFSLVAEGKESEFVDMLLFIYTGGCESLVGGVRGVIPTTVWRLSSLLASWNRHHLRHR